ncbi:MAG: 1-(5-phosphoribosyl)-5-[(5-phosphoribosylamino)methylideneamino]imidazole-4-carboxamide isomerase [Candidatus Hydrogenedentes bacterium]|nr:1-(5-phosphoribosyl)-5-[(5-phosphoribosylamino)methylideneamino]imidazole-4-carboxamide isomerase [Candidatus Hydrogenedentota bacterium]
MRVVPAVDIRGGLCVNLVQGDYDQETVFGQDPVSQALKWREQGAEIVHIVDLDGARAGELRVKEAILQISAVRVPVEVGGGIRSMRDLDAAFEAGAARAILGTAAFRDPEFLRTATRTYPGLVAVGIDARAGKVSLSAWMEDTQADAIGFARQVEEAGACRIIYTDILSDGMMKGPNLEATRAVAKAVNIPVTVSGGVSSLEDIRRVCTAQPDGVDEVIVGRALYVGAFTLPEAIEVAREGP